MKDRLITLRYEVYDQPADLDAKDAELLERAVEALQHSYSPYSNFKVAAALLLTNGEIICGSNQENASYPLCLCAERVALSAAAAVHPGVSVDAIAITARSPSQVLKEPISPCGACRQVLVETEAMHQQPMRVILRGAEGKVFVIGSAAALLPLSFDGRYL
ncbi:MAG: cytidine deaminase [Bacteroidota bacterium]